MKNQNKLNYKPVFEETVDAIIITDGLSEKIIEVNKSACELLGWEKPELLNMHLKNVLEENFIANDPVAPSQIKMYGSVLSDRRIKTKQGLSIPVDLTINTFIDESGNYVMTTLRDVSERIKYENEIVSMNEILIKTNASKDKLFSIIAHDLKNPMSALIGLSELMTNENEEISPEEMTEFLVMIKNLSKNTYELLENLLNWARVQTKNIEITKTKFGIKLLVDKIIEILKPSADLKKVEIINSVDTNLFINADNNMMNTIIRNLISNSIKFSAKNSKITICSSENDESWNISVKDEGIGMDEKLIEDLFRIDINTSRYGTNKEKGTGLGLVLCNEFVKLHGGKLEVQSEVNKGSEFIIKLPKEI